ncbi:ferritin subunit [Thrips palmi]|uniref:Ferritin n=1 Tax=Thrips palmi TaxID=161013 RepID=A0A6P8YN20_THRPL|nr:ferritin subunit [Thrips palmi]
MSPLHVSVAVLAVFAFAACGVSADKDKFKCKLRPADIPKEWVSMVDPCVKKMREQVQTELTASMTYLAMAAHFSQDTVNRPGFAEHFFKSASEEREHAIKLIEYLLMRGQLTKDVGDLIKDPRPKGDVTSWVDGVSALKDALKLEASVTNNIRDIVAVCEDPGESKFNDYHLVDYLTGDFLDEQYKGQRELAGMISTLDKMMHSHGAIGEFLFDKKLLG